MVHNATMPAHMSIGRWLCFQNVPMRIFYRQPLDMSRQMLVPMCMHRCVRTCPCTCLHTCVYTAENQLLFDRLKATCAPPCDEPVAVAAALKLACPTLRCRGTCRNTFLRSMPCLEPLGPAEFGALDLDLIVAECQKPYTPDPGIAAPDCALDDVDERFRAFLAACDGVRCDGRARISFH